MRSVFITFVLAVAALAQQEIPLYPGVAPGSENWNWTERQITSPNGMPIVQNVVRPVLQCYPAPKAVKPVGTAYDRGARRRLPQPDDELRRRRHCQAPERNRHRCFRIEEYRLTYTDPDAKAQPGNSPQAGQNLREISGLDGQQAMRVLRQHATEFGFRPDRIGMIGFSAGGYVILAAATAGPAETRPNFAAAIFITRREPTPPSRPKEHRRSSSRGSCRRPVRRLPGLPLDLFSAWRKANVPVELLTSSKPACSTAFGKKGGGADHFMDRLEEWLKVNGLLTK